MSVTYQGKTVEVTTVTEITSVWLRWLVRWTA